MGKKLKAACLYSRPLRHPLALTLRWYNAFQWTFPLKESLYDDWRRSGLASTVAPSNKSKHHTAFHFMFVW
jgi:hypothetical protein